MRQEVGVRHPKRRRPELDEEVLRQRLLSASMRVTPARIKILQTLGRTPMNADALSRHMCLIGEPFSVSTVYRSLQELETHKFLIKDMGADRKFIYRLKPEEVTSTSFEMTSLASGQTVVFGDAKLRRRLNVLLREHGFANEGGLFTLTGSVGRVLKPSGDA